jgi:hypothetical protein
MSLEIKTQPQSSAQVTNTSVSASIDNSISFDANIGVNANKDTGIAVGASAKTGTIASAGAGLDGKNVFVEVSYSDTTEIHATVEAKVGSHGVGTSGSVDAYAKSGTEMQASMKVGQNGVKAEGGVSSGSYVGVDAEGTIKARGVSGTGGAGITVGDHFEIGGGGEASFEQGKINLGISGDVAALVGVEVDAGVSVDTKQIQHDAIAVANETVKVEKIVESQVKETTKKVENTAKKVGKDIKKGMKKIF